MSFNVGALRADFAQFLKGHKQFKRAAKVMEDAHEAAFREFAETYLREKLPDGFVEKIGVALANKAIDQVDALVEKALGIDPKSLAADEAAAPSTTAVERASAPGRPQQTYSAAAPLNRFSR